ncbi:MAG TPA: outer-membrane lipoprotein carrier protein LolA [Chthonomonadaceae bacterium]|nr:outer-membrane lipoprotein carrier protein LolA [Chthonomonadaceae bacterium]
MASARADEKADALLKQVAAARKAVQSLTADISVNQQVGSQVRTITGTVKIKKPDMVHITIGAPVNRTIISDGKTLYVLMPGNQYMKQPVPTGPSPDFLPGNLLFDPQSAIGAKLAESKPRYLGTETVAGKTYRVLALTPPAPPSATMKLYVDANNLVTRTETDMNNGQAPLKMVAALSNIKINPNVAVAEFQYTPPATAKLYTEPSVDANLVPVGKAAPAFSLPTPAGSHVSLADAGKGKKAIMVNFWFYT